MKTKSPKERSLINYRGSIPEILRYQLITKSLIFVLARLFRLTRGALLWTTDRSAVTSGDIPFLLRSVQGWGLMILGLLLLLIYLVFDINAMIILSSKVLHQKVIRVHEIVPEAFKALCLFREPFGLLLILYAAFLVPIAGVGLGISLTDSLYIPNFVTSVITSNRWMNLLYLLILAVILFLTFYYIFTFHYIILNKQKSKTAWKNAGYMMKKNWKNFLKRYLGFFLGTLLVGIAIVLVITVLLFVIAVIANTKDPFHFRVMITFFSYLILAVAEVYVLLFTPFQVIALTRIFETYTEEDEGDILFPPRRHHPFMTVITILLFAFLFIASIGTAEKFDEYFPPVAQAEIIAHRGGGTLGNENTVLGLNKAIEAGANASEVDIQKTKDGHYILNHDESFLRLAGEKRSSLQMTLAEIRQLQVPDNFNIDGISTDFATFEEILDAARGRIHLYAELKNSTANRESAEELYQITKEKNMLDQVTFICFKYPLISYLEKVHPDIHTGYLCYAAFGDLEDLDVDELFLEEETATPYNIEKIHKAGKKVGVWTVNTMNSMVRFYSRDVDSIITDYIPESLETRELLQSVPETEFLPFYKEEYEDMKRVLLRTAFVWWP